MEALRRIYDVAVVGAGVVGCAVARQLSLAGLSVVVLERGRDILAGASKGNSAILHTGFDAPPESLELACMRAGRDAYLRVRESLNLPLLETGAHLVAWNEEEAARLPGLLERAHTNGVTDVRRLERRELNRLEPGLAGHAVAALHIPGEHVIDPWSAPLAYLLHAVANGAAVMRSCEVRNGHVRDDLWQLETGHGQVRAEVVINCAGLFGDRVEALARPSPFRIRPRKGQFVVFDKSARRELHSIILPVPTETTKGVLVAPTVFGNILAGPTAEDQDEREDTAVDGDTLRELIARGAALVPRLAEHPVTAAYAGLRPATEHKDYQIEALPERQWITIGGIRSTGLTAALGIAEHVARLYAEHFQPLRPVARPVAVRVPNLAEHLPRPYQLGGSGEIVCHCEWVTRGEIEAATRGPLAARDVGGLKRRTRAMLGRCQGFFCAWRVAALTRDRVHWPLPDAPTKPPLETDAA
ncbi:MAG: NAD(P)/FAD-dependent oxidoreductase [Gammaproteobacteria bacterium]|nr:NAD(P)/FAD-dependent oxidoreductase [Gammaproteobacteria bacterium]NIR83001.1 NAD(P)/FAD-dependent oxidoreductase [Gammaproteobacteria bacterium]NIR90656.1 NAD(P)/FAD-dependent oxidoreductase [Gammaproteobacteria bacterium]NIU04158.1 NAD(P)/FAD-dependent oxidoreductase [Gammaproteobacteria bacterium]NIV51449.1 FAD-dependent oxidoreductase [Gammaproteobacteria bacterium]